MTQEIASVKEALNPGKRIELNILLSQIIICHSFSCL